MATNLTVVHYLSRFSPASTMSFRQNFVVLVFFSQLFWKVYVVSVHITRLDVLHLPFAFASWKYSVLTLFEGLLFGFANQRKPDLAYRSLTLLKSLVKRRRKNCRLAKGSKIKMKQDWYIIDTNTMHKVTHDQINVNHWAQIELTASCPKVLKYQWLVNKRQEGKVIGGWRNYKLESNIMHNVSDSQPWSQWENGQAHWILQRYCF